MSTNEIDDGHGQCAPRPDYSEEFRRLEKAARNFQSGHDRMAVHRLLEKIFDYVERWNEQGNLAQPLYAMLDKIDRPIPLRVGGAYNVVIFYLVPDLDAKLRSKWCRVLSLADKEKRRNEKFRGFVKRRGGMNACAAAYAESNRVAT